MTLKCIVLDKDAVAQTNVVLEMVGACEQVHLGDCRHRLERDRDLVCIFS